VSRISRRRFVRGIGTLGVALAAGCAPRSLTIASPTPRLRRIGLLVESAPSPQSVESIETFRRGLGELGYVEGRDFEFHERNAQSIFERLPALASELVETPVDVIVIIGTARGALAAKAATSATPIVFGSAGNVVRQGIVPDLARPGGNITGVTNLGRPAKRLELLKETAPDLVRLAHLGDARGGAELANITRDTVEDCRTLGLACVANVIQPTISSLTELEATLQAIERARPDGLFIWVGIRFLGAAGFDRVLDFAIEHRLPQMWDVDAARRGALIGMTESLEARYRIVARQVDRILKGANPGDLPVEENTFVDIVLNRSMARKIGVTFPDSVLRQATEVID
jgi:putative ABC transport system substrate-binding protein